MAAYLYLLRMAQGGRVGSVFHIVCRPIMDPENVRILLFYARKSGGGGRGRGATDYRRAAPLYFGRTETLDLLHATRSYVFLVIWTVVLL